MSRGRKKFNVKVQDDTKQTEDTAATEASLTDVTITNVLTDNSY